jgi:hypothetical protein
VCLSSPTAKVVDRAEARKILRQRPMLSHEFPRRATVTELLRALTTTASHAPLAEHERGVMGEAPERDYPGGFALKAYSYDGSCGL